MTHYDTIYKKVATLEAGKGFGELALVNKRGLRQATIQAEEYSYLGVISKEDFDRCLAKIE